MKKTATSAQIDIYKICSTIAAALLFGLTIACASQIILSSIYSPHDTLKREVRHAEIAYHLPKMAHTEFAFTAFSGDNCADRIGADRIGEIAEEVAGNGLDKFVIYNTNEFVTDAPEVYYGAIEGENVHLFDTIGAETPAYSATFDRKAATESFGGTQYEFANCTIEVFDLDEASCRLYLWADGKTRGLFDIAAPSSEVEVASADYSGTKLTAKYTVSGDECEFYSAAPELRYLHSLWELEYPRDHKTRSSSSAT